MNAKIETLKGTTFFQSILKLINTFRSLIALEPIMTNLIAIAIGLSLLCLLKYPELLPNLGKYHKVFIFVLQGLVGYQIIKSSIKSALLPLTTVTFALIGIVIELHYPEFLTINIQMLHGIMVIGIIGLAVSVFYIR